MLFWFEKHLKWNDVFFYVFDHDIFRIFCRWFSHQRTHSFSVSVHSLEIGNSNFYRIAIGRMCAVANLHWFLLHLQLIFYHFFFLFFMIINIATSVVECSSLSLPICRPIFNIFTNASNCVCWLCVRNVRLFFFQNRLSFSATRTISIGSSSFFSLRLLLSFFLPYSLLRHSSAFRVRRLYIHHK